MKKDKKMKKFWETIGIFINSAFLILTVLLGICVYSMGVLPDKYILVVNVTLAIMYMIMLILYLVRKTKVFSALLMIVLCVVLSGGIYYIVEYNDMIEDITEVNTVETHSVGVYVLNDSKFQVLEDMHKCKFGVLNEETNTFVQDTILNLTEDMGGDLDKNPYNEVSELMEALKNRTVGAVVLEESFLSIVSDLEEFAWVETDLRKITEVAHEVEIVEKEELVVPEEIDDTFIAYVSGIDTYGKIQSRSRSDVNILAVVNTTKKEILLLSTPRDSYVVFDASHNKKDKLTHAGIYGIDQSMNALERIYDIDIDYYLRVNFSGFTDIIDAMGGVEVYSESAFKTYKKGMNHLNGTQALSFARERYSFSDGDYHRARNQMAVIQGVINKATSKETLLNVTDVMAGVSGSFETNMPKEQIGELVQMQLNDMAEWKINSHTTKGTSRRATTYSMPGRSLYVIDLSEANIKESKEMIEAVCGK